MRLEGKRTIVTGAAAGIGEGIALAFANEGARVALMDKDADGLEAVYTSMREAGHDVHMAVTDVTDTKQVKAAVEGTVDAFGGLDVVVNNAGAALVGTVEEIPEDRFDLQIKLNVSSVYNVSRTAWPYLRASGGGAIVNTASICGIWGFPGLAAYCASKGAVMLLTKCMALDGAEDNIRCNAVCPGDTETPNIRRYYNSFDDPQMARRRAEAAHPLNRLAQPADIAAGFVFLASDEAKYLTGSHIVIDGGRTSGVWYPEPIEG